MNAKSLIEEFLFNEKIRIPYDTLMAMRLDELHAIADLANDYYKRKRDQQSGGP